MISTRLISFLTNQLAEFAMFQCSMKLNKSILSRNIFGSSSAIFGNLRKPSEIFGKCLEWLVKPSDNILKIFGNLRKMVENLWKIVRNVVVGLYNKQSITWLLWDMEFIFSCSNPISPRNYVLSSSNDMNVEYQRCKLPLTFISNLFLKYGSLLLNIKKRK